MHVNAFIGMRDELESLDLRAVVATAERLRRCEDAPPCQLMK